MTREPPASTGSGGPLAGVSRDIGLRNGLIAFVLVFVLIGVFLLVELGSALGSAMGSGGGRLLLVGSITVTYGSHAGAFQGPGLLAIAGGTIPGLLYYLVPIGVLAWSGRRAASAAAVRTPEQAAVAGASVVGGYAIGVAASYLLLVGIAASFGGGFAGTDQFPRIFLVVGLVYPAVFGGIGGFTTTMNGFSTGSGQQRDGSQERSGGRQRTPPSSRQPPVCPDCGAANTQGARYCTECDSPLSAID